MKKATALLLVLIMAIPLVACGNKDGGETPAPATPAPALTEEVNEVVAEEVNDLSVIEVTGTANIERGEEELSTREGMRLQNLDTMRTMEESAAWLLLEKERAVELGELTALHIDKQDKGFVLTLSEGEVTARIDRPLAADEEFTVKAGNLALAVRGTVFTAWFYGDTVTVSVERGEVAVLDWQGNEIAVLGAGEWGNFADEVANVSNDTQVIDGLRTAMITSMADPNNRTDDVAAFTERLRDGGATLAELLPVSDTVSRDIATTMQIPNAYSADGAAIADYLTSRFKSSRAGGGTVLGTDIYAVMEAGGNVIIVIGYSNRTASLADSDYGGAAAYPDYGNNIRVGID
jgi:hypothetical protein